MQSNGTWSGWGIWGGQLITNAAPAATVYDNRVHIVAKGLSQTVPAYSNKISISSSSGDMWGPSGMRGVRFRVAD